MKPRPGSFEEINKTDKPLANLISKRREHTNYQYQQWKKDVTTDSTDVKRITREYYEHLYANIFNNFSEMKNSLKNSN